MNNSEPYVIRDVVCIDFRDLDTNILHTDRVVFKDQYKTHFDFGKLAYSKRRSGRGSVVGGVSPVLLSSLDRKRLPFLRCVFEMVRMMSTGSQVAFCTSLSLFFSYVDDGKTVTNFESFDSVIEAYKNFIRSLKHRTQINTIIATKMEGSSRSSSYAQNLKKVLELAVSVAFNVPVKSISSRIPIIFKHTQAERAGRRRAKTITKDSLRLHTRFCENFIHVVHEIVQPWSIMLCFKANRSGVALSN